MNYIVSGHRHLSCQATHHETVKAIMFFKTQYFFNELTALSVPNAILTGSQNQHKR